VSKQEDLNNTAELMEVVGFDISNHIYITLKVLKILSTPARLMMHYNIGERAISPLSVVFHTAIILFVGIALGGGFPVIGFAVAFVVIATIHYVVIFMRRAQGKEWHSRSMGESLPFLRYLPFAKNNFILHVFYEPILFVIVTGLLTQNSPQMGLYLLFVTVSIILQVQLEYSAARDAYLDQVDQKIEGEIMKEMMAGKPITNTRGATTAGSVVGTLSGMSEEKRAKLLEGLGIKKAPPAAKTSAEG